MVAERRPLRKQVEFLIALIDFAQRACNCVCSLVNVVACLIKRTVFRVVALLDCL